jgi:FMN phosphatase YigB (HAD superfamily)
MVLVSKQEDDRRDLLEQTGLSNFFAEIVFTSAKTPELFREVMDRYGAKPCHVWVIGDYLHEEIRAGNQIGAFTIRLKRGVFAQMLPECADDIPNGIVVNLQDALAFFGST